MILSTALIFLNGVVLLTLAKPPSSDSGQQLLTQQYGKMLVAPPKFSVIDWLDKKSAKSPLKNFEVTRTEALDNVPDSLFSHMPQHKQVIEVLLEDIQRGNHLLLVEKSGFENKQIANRLLQILGRPTEYIQLHRDTTISSLTVEPTAADGTGIYEDSPLVRAVKYGHVLVVDEADKAPTTVTSSLYTLMQNKEMGLSDGRMVMPMDIVDIFGGKSESFIPVHKDFRMIVMASRTGFPFLDKDVSDRLEFKTGEVGTTVEAVGLSPMITTAVMAGYSSGTHTATALASDSAVATATALTYGWGTSTATAIASGSSVASATAHSYDGGVATATVNTTGSSVASSTARAQDSSVATATANTSGSAVARAQAQAAGRQVVTDTQNRS